MKSNVTYLQTDDYTPFFERVCFGSEISPGEMIGTFPLKNYYHSILDISSPEQLVQDTKEDLPQSKNCPNVDVVSFT